MQRDDPEEACDGREQGGEESSICIAGGNCGRPNGRPQTASQRSEAGKEAEDEEEDEEETARDREGGSQAGQPYATGAQL